MPNFFFKNQARYAYKRYTYKRHAYKKETYTTTYSISSNIFYMNS